MLSISLRFDVVQHRIASIITKEVGAILETPMNIGSLRVIHLDEIVLKDISLCDQSGDTIVYAQKATAHISPQKLLDNRIQINTLAIANPDIRISRNTPQSPLNIQFIIDKLKKDSSKNNTKFALRINQVLVYDGKFRYDIQNAPKKEHTFDPSHIDIDSIECNISMKKVFSDELDLLIRSIKGHERSGLNLNKLKTSVKASNENIQLYDTKILFPNSSLFSDSVSIAFSKSNPKALEFIGNLHSEKFTLTDFAPLTPEIPKEIPPLSFNISSRSDSTLSRNTITVESLDKNIALKTIIAIEKPYDKERITKIYLRHLNLTKDGISSLQPFVKHNTIDIANKTGNCYLNGEAELTAKGIDGNLRAETDNGNITTYIKYNYNGNYDITAEGDGISISNIAGIREPLSCSLQTKAYGCLNKEIKSIQISGAITDLESSRYAFSPIEFSGEYKNTTNSLTANLKSEDPGLTALMHLNYIYDNQHRVALSLNVDSLAPSKIGLHEKLEEIFSFKFDGEFTYKNKQESMLNAKLQNFTFSNANERRTIRNLHFCDNRTEEQRLTMINSDIIDFSIIGKYDYESIINSLYKLASTHTPSLTANTNTTSNNNCNYIFKGDIKNSHFVSSLLKLPITINMPSSINGVCNDERNIFTINTTLNDVVINKSKYNTIGFNAESTPKDLSIRSKIIKPSKKSKNANDDLNINIDCRLFNDTIQNTVTWGNKKSKRAIKGKLGMEVMLNRDENELLSMKAVINPDSIIQNDSIWYISGSTVSGNLDRININGLYLYNDHQHLRIDGFIGKSKEDVLNISASNLEVSTILDLVKFRILKFNGNATGSATASSLLSAPEVNGFFNVDSFKIDNGYLGNTDLNIGWRNDDKSIFLNADIHNDTGETTKVNGFLSEANDTIHLDIDANKLNAVFINKMVKSFMSDIKGTGSGKVSLLGKWREVNLVGAVALNCSARVNPTNVRYTFHGDSLYFTRNRFHFDEVHATDKYGNSGWLSGEVTHTNLGNWACDLNARVNNMLVYDTHNFDDAPFYGTIFATGNANLIANSKGLFLKAEVRNEANSRLIYNSSESGSARDNSFVTFIDSNKKHTDEKLQEQSNTSYKNIESNMNLDFLIDVNEGLQVKVYTNLKSDDYIDLYGKGAINAVYDEKEGFSLKGNLDLDRGTYKITVQDIFTKEFSFIKGSSLLFNGAPYDATLNLKAKYLVPSASLSALTAETTNRKSVKVNCLMDITGTLASPILKFDLELPEGSEEEKEMLASATSTQEQKNMQFIYLLGIGRFYTYDNNNSTTDNAQSSTAVESLISNTLSGQLNNMLGQIIDNGNWNISGNFSTSERGWNSMEVEGMLEGRLLNDRLLINGNLGYRENPVANRNVIGDFELQWLLNRTGTISLRAYSKTNDRYFSKTNLTTQGAGIILRHDFNSWKWWKKDDEEKGEKKEKRVKKKVKSK